MKKRVLLTVLIVLGVVWSVAGILITVFYLIPRFDRLEENTEWNNEVLEPIVVEEVHRLAESDEPVVVRKYEYVEYNVEIAEKNRAGETNEYPFAKLTVHAECGRVKYVLYFEKASDGSLVLVDYESRRQFLPTLGIFAPLNYTKF